MSATIKSTSIFGMIKNGEYKCKCIWVDKKGKYKYKYKNIWTGLYKYKYEYSDWYTQMQIWIQIFVTHNHEICHKLYTDEFCVVNFTPQNIVIYVPFHIKNNVTPKKENGFYFNVA